VSADAYAAQQEDIFSGAVPAGFASATAAGQIASRLHRVSGSLIEAVVGIGEMRHGLTSQILRSHPAVHQLETRVSLEKVLDRKVLSRV
jgi:hypothetical protein